LKHIGRGWERTFVELIPKNIEYLSTIIDSAVVTFANRMATRSNLNKLNTFQLAAKQVPSYQAKLRDTAGQRKVLKTSQQDTRKVFTRVVSELMSGTYRQCAREGGKSELSPISCVSDHMLNSESGEGCFKRMKDIISTKLEDDHSQMFVDVVTRAKAILESILGPLQDKVSEKK
jgi:hypothetical protein